MVNEQLKKNFKAEQIDICKIGPHFDAFNLNIIILTEFKDIINKK